MMILFVLKVPTLAESMTAPSKNALSAEILLKRAESTSKLATVSVVIVALSIVALVIDPVFAVNLLTLALSSVRLVI